MSFLVLSIGILIWVSVTYDILITTLTTGGAGPITGPSCRSIMENCSVDS